MTYRLITISPLGRRRKYECTITGNVASAVIPVKDMRDKGAYDVELVRDDNSLVMTKRSAFTVGTSQLPIRVSVAVRGIESTDTRQQSGGISADFVMT